MIVMRKPARMKTSPNHGLEKIQKGSDINTNGIDHRKCAIGEENDRTAGPRSYQVPDEDMPSLRHVLGPV